VNNFILETADPRHRWQLMLDQLRLSTRPI
jgi:hypothetical protein